MTPDILKAGLDRNPDICVATDGQREWSFRYVDERAGRAAGFLKSQSVASGDRVAALCKNELEYFELQIACQRVGASFVPLNFRLSPSELKVIVDDARPKLLLVGRDHEQQAASLGLPMFGLEGSSVPASYEEAMRSSEWFAHSRMHPAGSVAQILYTSGTTGKPKGAMVTNGALHARLMTYAFEMSVTPADMFVQLLPMFHLSSSFAYAHAIMGAGSIILRTVDPDRIWPIVAEKRGTCILLVPTILKMLLDSPTLAGADIGSLRSIIYGGSPIAPTLLTRALEELHVGFLHMYGLTEAGAASIARPVDHDFARYPDRVNSVGVDMLGYETAVHSLEGVPVPAGHVGEIVIRGPGTMIGYWENEQATQETIGTGWLRTGDVGYKNGDGILFVTDRLKDMIISGGENVYSQEVERVLATHPSVLECAILGAPDDHYGEIVHAVIVVSDPSGLDDIKAYCRRQLAGYKNPRLWSVVEAMPKNSMGKISKVELKQALVNRG